MDRESDQRIILFIGAATKAEVIPARIDLLISKLLVIAVCPKSSPVNPAKAVPIDIASASPSPYITGRDSTKRSSKLLTPTKAVHKPWRVVRKGRRLERLEADLRRNQILIHVLVLRGIQQGSSLRGVLLPMHLKSGIL